MSRLIDSFEQILDGSGDPLALGLLDFFVSGSSSTRKKTYADAAETIENTNPVVVGGDGRCPNVFGTGTYNVILRTSAGVQLLARDPVGGSDSLTFGADWVASTSYSATDQVRDDGNYWQSVTNLNQGNQPSLNDGSNWLKTDFLNITVNTLAIAALNTATTNALALKYDKTGGALSGQATSTAGDFNLVVNTALSNAAATLTATQLIGGEFTITPTVARIQTLDTAANIISALSGSVDGSNFTFAIVNLAAYDVTIATATGVTLVGNMVVNDSSATFRVRRTSGSTVSVTRLDNVAVSSGINLQTAVATTSGTSIDYTGIPTGVKRINIMFEDVSINATTYIIIQLGDSGGVETSGYSGSAWTANTVNTSYSNGFLLTASTSEKTFSGALILNLQDASGFKWNGSGSIGLTNTPAGSLTGGTKSLSSELTQIRLTSASGSAVFDSGSINISWEF